MWAGLCGRVLNVAAAGETSLTTREGLIWSKIDPHINSTVAGDLCFTGAREGRIQIFFYCGRWNNTHLKQESDGNNQFKSKKSISMKLYRCCCCQTDVFVTQWTTLFTVLWSGTSSLSESVVHKELSVAPTTSHNQILLLIMRGGERGPQCAGLRADRKQLRKSRHTHTGALTRRTFHGRSQRSCLHMGPL